MATSHQYIFGKIKQIMRFDCIVDLGKRVIALEIKAGRTVNRSFFDGLSHWEKVIAKGVTRETYVIYGAHKKQISGYKNVVSWQSIAEVVNIE